MNPLIEEGHEKTVHPFFQKPLRTSSTAGNNVTPQNRALDSSHMPNGEQADLLEVDPNNSRRKRRKTASPEVTTESEAEKISTITKTTAPTKTVKPLRASKRKQTTLTPAKSKIVVMRYGSGQSPASEVGSKIENILNGIEILIPKTESNIADVKNIKEIVSRKGNGVDAIPWWKTAKKKSPTQEEPQESSKSQQLGQGKKSPTGKRSTSGRPASPSTIVSNFGRPHSRDGRQAPPTFRGFGTAPKTSKFPDAIEPAWPWSGMVHVRGERDEEYSNGTSTSTVPGESSDVKKGSKYRAVEIVEDENIINTFTAKLRIDETINSIHDLHIHDFAPVSPCLRVPSKHIETGPSLQCRVRKELISKPSRPVVYEDLSDDELREPDKRRSNTHPALTNIYNSIATSLSAFDKAECENLSWTQKYAPKSADEILQTGREAFILKDWLQKLTVMSVESGSAESKATKRSASSKAEPAGKRKRKSKKLDNFIVSDGEEDNEMDEITEPEEGDLLGGAGLVKKTVMRSGDLNAKGSKDSKRLANAVVLSGPHGCGKSATVFAVAKELGFEVFEINPNSKRSGKEVMDKVGDMTRNHLVQRSKVDKIPSANEDEENSFDSVAEEVKSGRQGTMNSFFTSKAPIKPEPKSKGTMNSFFTSKAPTKPKGQNDNEENPSNDMAEDLENGRPGMLKPFFTSKEPTKMRSENADAEQTAAKTDANKDITAPKGPPKKQQQSLILLEEVDVLFEEDRGFWQTVLLLIAQSKRPIIITCNDEAAVPILALSLHAIIRFTTVPTDLAVDYMLLVAANEGHAIRRDAVKALYESRASDLRGSLTELEFWCQFAVGDRKAGMEWFYPRLPLGCDLDEHGKKYRVVSEDTYHTGMGWISQDTLESQRPYIDIEEETLHEAWNGWGIDVGDWQQNLDISTWADKITDCANERATRRAALAMYDDFAEAMSATDCFSHNSFGVDYKVTIDASYPKMSSKAREDYTMANQLLDVSPQITLDETSINISFWMKSRAREVLQIRQHVEHGWEIHRELDGPTEKQVQGLIRSQSRPHGNAITRRDLSLAFDPISESEKTYVWSTGNLEACCFDRTMNLIILDVAPYVRSIVSYDARLQKDRVRLSNLLSQNGGNIAPKPKRMRTTRAAMSALEGGTRSTTRKEKYFSQDINPYFVLRTGSQSWLDAVISITAATDDGSRRSSIQMSESNTGTDNGKDELLD